MKEALAELSYRFPMYLERLLFAFLGLTERLGRPNTIEHVMDITKKYLVIVAINASQRAHTDSGLVVSGCRIVRLEQLFDEEDRLM